MPHGATQAGHAKKRAALPSYTVAGTTIADTRRFFRALLLVLSSGLFSVFFLSSPDGVAEQEGDEEADERDRGSDRERDVEGAHRADAAGEARAQDGGQQLGAEGERSKRGGYKSQKLPGGDHTALGDARATLHLIERMAEGA